MSTTSDGGQLSPCVKLFIELLLQGDSGVKSSDAAVVLRPEEAATGPQGWSSPLLRFPEKVNERFAASCRRCPRWAVEVESIEKGEDEPFDNGCNLSSEGEARHPHRHCEPHAEVARTLLHTLLPIHGVSGFPVTG